MEYTEDEIRGKFINHVRANVEYWNGPLSEPYDQRERLSGLAFSIMVLLDGGTMVLPSFIVAPHPHSDDKQYHIDNEEDYFPENHELDDQIKGDIGGCLHEMLYHNWK